MRRFSDRLSCRLEMFSPVFYCVVLYQVIYKSYRLQNIVWSVTRNGRNLLLTGFLMLVVIFTSSVIGYYYFSEYFDESFGAGANCDTLARCFYITLTVGMRQGGGIGDALNPAYFTGRSYGVAGYLRLLFDFVNFVILIVLFLNIVFGIILDTFEELRQQREDIQTDQLGKCFICGMEQSSFDRYGRGGFEHHTKFEHKMWDYLYLMHYVKLKPKAKHSGLEAYVWECMEKKSPDFFPVQRALVLDVAQGNGDVLSGFDADAGSDDNEESGAGQAMAEPPDDDSDEDINGERATAVLERLERIERLLTPPKP